MRNANAAAVTATATATVARASVPRPGPRSSMPGSTPSPTSSMVVARHTPAERVSTPPPLPARARGRKAHAPTSVAQPITRRMISLCPDGTGPREDAPTLIDSPQDDLVTTLFERLHALEYFDDALEGARFCLESLAAVFPSRALLVHLFDIERKEFLVVDAMGEAADALKLMRVSHTDLLLRLSMRKACPVAWRKLDEAAPLEVLARFADLPRARTVVIAPVLAGPRWLGAIELVDPVDESFPIEQENALRYVADRYAQFLGRRGVVVDVVSVARFAFRAE